MPEGLRVQHDRTTEDQLAIAEIGRRLPDDRGVVLVAGRIVRQRVRQVRLALDHLREQVRRERAVHDQIVRVVEVSGLQNEALERVGFGGDRNVELSTAVVVAELVGGDDVGRRKVSLRIGVVLWYQRGAGSIRGAGRVGVYEKRLST